MDSDSLEYVFKLIPDYATFDLVEQTVLHTKSDNGTPTILDIFFTMHDIVSVSSTNNYITVRNYRGLILSDYLLDTSGIYIDNEVSPLPESDIYRLPDYNGRYAYAYFISEDEFYKNKFKNATAAKIKLVSTEVVQTDNSVISELLF